MSASVDHFAQAGTALFSFCPNTENNMFEAIKWPADLTPSRSPIHFTNELEVAASAETIWSLLVDPAAWPGFYPGVEHVQLLDGHESLRLGTRFETNLAGQDVFASVQEFEPMTRIAWGGYPKAR
ncbi:SRPBCC family protein [Mesorhizobium sp. M0048]|uniref:SRPBCC family protein n=1 Tax=Mesorhizobium sp. M0048 TaxID=2956860 RepID=UPI00333CBDB7